jgi:hypothetical protein
MLEALEKLGFKQQDLRTVFHISSIIFRCFVSSDNNVRHLACLNLDRTHQRGATICVHLCAVTDPLKRHNLCIHGRFGRARFYLREYCVWSLSGRSVDQRIAQIRTTLIEAAANSSILN